MVKRSEKINSKLNLKKQFKEALTYLKKSLNYIYLAIFLFVASAVFGFVYAKNLTFIDEILKEIVSKTLNLGPLELIFFILQNNLQSAFISLAGGILLSIGPILFALSNGTIIGYVMSRSYQAAGIGILWRLIPHGIFELPAIFISLGLGIKLGFSIINSYFTYFWRKNKTLIFLPIIAIIFFSITNIFYRQDNLANINNALPKNLTYALFFIFTIAFIFVIFMLFAFIFDKQWRQKLLKTLNFYSSANTFLMVVIPLLIIAAIIEGFLIVLIK